MINIFIPVNQNAGLVWNADDWLKLREEYRIVGEFIGALPNYPRQESFKGLPLSLLPEEVTLLKEKQFAKLVQCPTLLQEPSEDLVKAFQEEEKRFHESQKEEYIKRKREDVERRYDQIVEGKRKKNPNFDAEFEGKESLIQEEIDKIKNVSGSNFISCTHTEDPWIKESDLIEATWKYPSNETEILKYDVFKDLWEQNYYLTSGGKFGGDFLCYRGDPFHFHADFIIICKKYHETFPAKDLIAHGRVGTSTKKTIVIATKYPAEDGGDSRVAYQSLQFIDNKELRPSTSN